MDRTHEKPPILGSEIQRNAYDFQTGKSGNGEVTYIDAPFDDVYEVSSMTYGQRGELNQYTTSIGVNTVTKDERMQRWRRSSGSVVDTRFRYGLGGELLERYAIYQTGSDSDPGTRDEYIYVQGLPIGVTHTDSNHPSPVSWWLGHDREGIPRRVIQRYSNMVQHTRLIMGAWGDATQIADTSLLSGYGVVSLPFRHAGQIADTGNDSMVDNKWRMYAPDLGVYLQPDPDHRASASMYAGPQAYGYAAGAPLRHSDPTGRIIDRSASGPDSLGVLSTVSGTAGLGQFISEIDSNDDIRVVIRRDGAMAPNGGHIRVPGTHHAWMSALQNTGGCSACPGSRGCEPAEFIVYWAPENAAIRTGHTSISASTIMAHELGHVYAAVQCAGRGRVETPAFSHGSAPYEASGISWAVGFENAVAGPPYMWPHEHAGYDGQW